MGRWRMSSGVTVLTNAGWVGERKLKLMTTRRNYVAITRNYDADVGTEITWHLSDKGHPIGTYRYRNFEHWDYGFITHMRILMKYMIHEYPDHVWFETNANGSMRSGAYYEGMEIIP